MHASVPSPGDTVARTGVSTDEKTFFDLVGPAVSHEPLHFICGDREYVYGPGPNRTVVRITDPDFFRRVLTQGNLGLGECYMDKHFDVVRGTLEDLLLALARADVERCVRSNPRNLVKLAGIYARNLFRGRYGNVQSHYDIGDELFESFLDESMAYSCGYLRSSDDTLGDLQRNKFDRICQKLRLKPGEHLLDIGCGFGGLLMHAAKQYDVRCTGITISHRHHEKARAIVSSKGLSDRVEILFSSHKDLPGTFDKVVSVGMMEHLRRGDYRVYVRNIKRSLKEGGMGLIHCIGCNGPKNKHDPFIQKYIFPGSGQPRLSEMAYWLERNRLAILDVENMARHYAPTAHAWLVNFQDNYPKLDHRKYDETFKRMWEYYLSCGVPGAMASDSALWQVLFANSYKIEIPWQRV
jgi:cyclopropane-fatty-acyl-phospholipid synthase